LGNDMDSSWVVVEGQESPESGDVDIIRKVD
jgi:hypothetical protein